MPNQQIYVLGYKEIVLMLGLLGIEGKILEKTEDFMKEFNILRKQLSIGMIIIGLDLPKDIFNFLIDFKLSNKRPFVYFLPNILKPNVKSHDIIFKRIFESINKKIS